MIPAKEELPLIAPSLLAADFSDLGREVARVAEAPMLHIDVMDGCFVPNLSIGPAVIAALRDKTDLFFDVHLMLSHPLKYIDAFRKAGADSISFHIECEDDPARVLCAIRESGARPGLAVSPGTDPARLVPYGRGLYLVTVMTVEPGFGGQKLMPECLEKIPYIKKNLPGALVEVDGGVNLETAPLCREADILVAGTAVFRAPQPALAIRQLREAVTAR